MASEDVIELGSSDDEAEPATKKMKPVPNAMVHIPANLCGVTIKPTKANMSSIPKELAGKNVTVTKISKGNSLRANTFVGKPKINGKHIKNLVQPLAKFPKQNLPKTFVQLPNQILVQPLVQLPKPVVVQNISAINPLNLMKKINSQVAINKVPPVSNLLKNPIRIQSPATINKLPPSITITRTTGTAKRTGSANLMNPFYKRQKVNQASRSPKISDVLTTVELDDDEMSSSSTANPKWYIRPEEDQIKPSLEETNNKEPEKDSLVEITIEDSPVKPPIKRVCDIGAELAITIDESPVKSAAEKEAASGSDIENQSDNKKNKQSKKKLEYPKETAAVSDSIEIAIASTMDTGQIPESVDKKADEQDKVIEIEESPLKVQGQSTSTPKKDHTKPIMESKIPIIKMQDDNELSEFHSVYESFIKLCFQLENSDDMKKIVEKKIKAYYRQVPKEYTESEEFIDMVSSKIVAMKASPEKMYLYIKDIVDELNLQRKMAKSQVLQTIQTKTSESDNFLYGEESEHDLKRQRQIRKLEKTLKKLHRAIQKLEEQEVDFDDDEDSVYLLTESDDGCTSNKANDRQLEKDPKALLQRYKERMVRVHAKFCQLTNTKMPSEPRVQIDARLGQPAGPAKRLEKWINKKVPIGTPLPFPDFHDVLRCVREANDEDKLGWNEADIMEEARDLFTRCGKKLQRRRQENEWRLAASRITEDIDPAEASGELKKKLEENKNLAAKREADVFNKYADRQSQLMLEAEEIGDKEADESPVESDDDDCNDEPSLQNKVKRKERLKRLLQEKSKKSDENKDLGVNNQGDVEMSNESKKTEIESIEVDSYDNKTENAVVNNESKMIEIEKPQSPKQKENNESKKEDIEIKDTLRDENNKLNENNKKKMLNTSKEKVDEKIIYVNNKHSSPKREDKIDDSEKIHSLSDDSDKVESDVDELHLLQKLHSGNGMNSSISESSGCDTPIAISDTLESSDNSKKAGSGVISIENSSYSESELNKDTTESKDDDSISISNKVTTESKDDESMSVSNKVVDELTDTEMECSTSGVRRKQITSNNEEYNESIEDILLASTDDDDESMSVDKTTKPIDEVSVNLKDDTISIGDTVVEGVDKAKGDTISIGDTVNDELSKAKEDTLSTGSGVTVVEEVDKAKEDTISIGDTVDDEVSKAKEDTLSTGSGVTFVEEVDKVKEDTISIGDTAVDRVDITKDDNISIGVTVVEEVDKTKEDTVSISDIIVESVDKEKESIDGNPTVTSIPEDSSSVDSVALVSTDDAVDEVTSDKEQNHVIESDSTKKSDDVTSVESVVCLSEKDDAQMDVDSKENEQTSEPLNSSERVLDDNKATLEAKTNDTIDTVQTDLANDNLKQSTNAAAEINTVDNSPQNIKKIDTIENASND